MATKETLVRGSWIAVGTLLFGGWVVLKGLEVLNTAEASFATGTTIGQTVVSGIVGLLVLVVVLGFLFVLYGELGENDPTPETFPPEQ
jgi:hypothetical protein